MKRLQVQGFGPIQQGDVEFGDLTVLVGPQATGKSLFVQLFKAIVDAGAIERDLMQYGFDWYSDETPVHDYCSLYFGSGLGYVIQSRTVILRDGNSVRVSDIVNPNPSVHTGDTVFLIPAQRVLVLQDGWPKPFMAYAGGDPYAIRKFSESLRLLMERERGSERAIFPRPKHLWAELGSVVDASIYVGSTLELEREGMRKRVVLKPSGMKSALPYTAWSAGQREFTPLLFGLYSVIPPTWPGRERVADIETVIIEEPEMGLHPQAIVSFGLLVLELLGRGYRVILSTHSPVILDLVWALRELSSVKPKVGVEALCRVFNIDSPTKPLKATLTSALQKQYRTYYFHRTDSGVITEDISTLDPGSEDPSVAGWGGLSGFSGRIAQIVGEAVSR
ncbi:AAA family ATPase [Polyangium sp. 15x6]|uniref:AAA family ATPase n=1 Tax=Polyangium sp. 15x6 TaxID=3042687 RepID=UPI00249AEDB6|nr:AAA family ATPase [Polyangium sp. 15x6]MDI3286694.1 AAA family ATPase [Polyangium sp. 15x6]